MLYLQTAVVFLLCRRQLKISEVHCCTDRSFSVSDQFFLCVCVHVCVTILDSTMSLCRHFYVCCPWFTLGTGSEALLNFSVREIWMTAISVRMWNNIMCPHLPFFSCGDLSEFLGDGDQYVKPPCSEEPCCLCSCAHLWRISIPMSRTLLCSHGAPPELEHVSDRHPLLSRAASVQPHGDTWVPPHLLSVCIWMSAKQWETKWGQGDSTRCLSPMLLSPHTHTIKLWYLVMWLVLVRGRCQGKQAAQHQHPESRDMALPAPLWG